MCIVGRLTNCRVVSTVVAALPPGSADNEELRAESLFVTETGKWLIAIWATTLGTNFLATCECIITGPASDSLFLTVFFYLFVHPALLAFRIWRVNMLSKEFLPAEPRSGLKVIFRVIVESGAFYSFSITLALVLFVTGSPAVFIVVDMVSTHDLSICWRAIEFTLQR